MYDEIKLNSIKTMSLLYVSYVSQLINRIRWRPVPKSALQSESSNSFVTGTWGYGQENKICLWSYKGYKDIDFDRTLASSAVNGSDTEPDIVSQVSTAGEIRELKFLSSDLLVAALSSGSVVLYRIEDNKLLKCHRIWERLHYFSNETAPCTSVAVRNDDIASVGEDGRLNIMNINKNEVIKCIENADNTSLTSVQFLRQIEVATGNHLGQLKVWDLRCVGDMRPARTLLLSGRHTSMLCIEQHPTQQFVVAIGGGDGMLYTWDLRQERLPVTVIAGHSGPITEVKFHPSFPNNLFTSSLDGGMWHWTISEVQDIRSAFPASKAPAVVTEGVAHSVGNPWVSYSKSTHGLNTVSMIPHSVLPINSFDINDTTLICSSDNQALYTVSEVKLS